MNHTGAVNAPIDLNRLTAFVLVAQTFSFAKTARRLGLTRSSVSRHIAALEDSLGVQLFHRSTRRVALSTAGESLFERVAPQMEQIRIAVGTLPDREQSPSGDLRITAPPDFAFFLSEVIAGFGLRYPGINLDLRLSSQRLDLVSEGIDVALRVATALPDSSLVARKLGQADAGLFASPAYLARRRSVRTWDDLRDHDLVRFVGFPLPPSLARFERRARIKVDDMMFAAQAIRSGMGLGFLPLFLTRSDVQTGRLVRVLPQTETRGGTLYFIYARARPVPKKVTAFRDHLLQYFAAHPV